MGGQRLLHLHRLEHHDNVTGRHVLPLAHGDLDDRALHPADQRLTAPSRGGSRAGRCSAWARLARVTISLAISESNTCGTVIPAAYPASSRTPGPDGGRHAVIVPGEGRKLRPGSSALILNSIECPRAGGSS